MTDIFINKKSWLDYANQHNTNAIVGSTLLNGSDSYTLVAVHLAAGKEIPKSIRLDTARKKGVADHFNGLREAYISGLGGQWLKKIMWDCQQLANGNPQLDVDEMIKKIINWTEKKGRIAKALENNTAPRVTNLSESRGFLPSKENCEYAYRMLSRLGESVSVDEILDLVEINCKENGHSLKNNWRVITEKNIELWAKKEI
jgi:hypothetical protein